jgi:hypothetical protein
LPERRERLLPDDGLVVRGLGGGVMNTLNARFNPRENNFDLIRIVAALVVLFAHSYALAQKEYDPLSSFLSYGFSGTLAVFAFLIISGFRRKVARKQ